MTNKKEIEAFKTEIGQTMGPDQFANKFLSKRLWQYKKIRIGRNTGNVLLALGDIYRNIRNFQDEVQLVLEETVHEMVKENDTDKEFIIYFPDIEKKLKIFPIISEESGETNWFANIYNMTDKQDWQKALKQHKELG